MSATVGRPPIITLTTDFGMQDSYVAQMKGVILDLNPYAQIVDVTHSIPAQNICAAAYILADAVQTFPESTIHVVVVDPGVGSSRRLVGVELEKHRFLAPDNGVLSPLMSRDQMKRAVSLNASVHWRHPVSQTFHGRDILSPVAAKWSLGVDLAEFGDAIEDSLVEFPVPVARRLPEMVSGEVLWVDAFGNLVTNIDEEILPKVPRSALTVELGTERITGLSTFYGQVSPGHMTAIIGSNGRLEIAVNQGSAAESLGLRSGAAVLVRFENNA